jgi:hypothetical protein
MAARYLADAFPDARVELITFGSAAGHNDAFAVRAHGGSHPIPSRLSLRLAVLSSRQPGATFRCNDAASRGAVLQRGATRCVASQGEMKKAVKHRAHIVHYLDPVPCLGLKVTQMVC